DDRAILQVQDPAKPENVDQYTYHHKVSAPRPVHLVGHGSLESNLFDFDAVAFDRLPALLDEAQKRTNLEGQRLTHLIIKRNLPFSKDVLIYVYLSVTRKNAMSKADDQGNILSTHLDCPCPAPPLRRPPRPRPARASRRARRAGAAAWPAWRSAASWPPGRPARSSRTRPPRRTRRIATT